MTICVYCASSDAIHPGYFEATGKLAEIFCTHSIGVVYGGGGSGLMGHLATTMLSHSGKVKGIMPHFMKEIEWAHKNVTEWQFVSDMHERKRSFLEHADAVVALPGGVGTFEELLEVITWKKLGLFTKPIVILNARSYYDPLIEMLSRSIAEGFMGEIHGTMYEVVNTPEEVLPAIDRSAPWDENAIRFAKTGDGLRDTGDGDF